MTRQSRRASRNEQRVQKPPSLAPGGRRILDRAWITKNKRALAEVLRATREEQSEKAEYGFFPKCPSRVQASAPVTARNTAPSTVKRGSRARRRIALRSTGDRCKDRAHVRSPEILTCQSHEPTSVIGRTPSRRRRCLVSETEQHEETRTVAITTRLERGRAILSPSIAPSTR